MHTQELAQQPSDAVLNQAVALEDYDMFEWDMPLRDALTREGAAWAESDVRTYAQELGRAEFLKLGELANDYPPELKLFDRFGHRIDVVEFHPAWHELMRSAIARGAHASVWSDPKPGAHVARAGLGHVRHQVEQGHSCPLTMTFAVVPSLRLQPDVAAEWLPKVLSRSYDERFAPIADKRGALFGMAMTERQGGSDVRANTTRATPLGSPGGGQAYRLNGHKWFCSAPMCDAFLVLAQTEEGLSCFLVPRFRPDGTQNTMRFMRLKSKLGNRSNASSEVFFEDCFGQLIGTPGRGVATILEMVRHTRLDCALGGASLIRRCVAEAAHHVRHRWAFGRRLSEQPLMKNVIADLALESEAATALAFRLARAFDDATANPDATAFARVATPVAKYWITKRETTVAREALECLGGNGFVEESGMPRLFRESPLNSIWEGAGNVQSLDLLRAIGREPDTLEAYFAEAQLAVGADARYDAALLKIKDGFADRSTLEIRARRVVEDMAKVLQAGLLLRHAPHAVGDAYVRSRLGGPNGLEHGDALGTLPPDVDFDAIIARSTPLVD